MGTQSKENALEEQVRQQLAEELKNKGHTQPVRPEEVAVTRDGNRITARWREFEVSMPVPSQETYDSAFKSVVKTVALVLAVGIVAIAGVVVGSSLSGGGGRSDHT